MSTIWTEITSADQWKEILNRSSEKPQLVFKHSTTCPISANAWQEFQAYLSQDPNEDADYTMVKVIESRPISLQIADDIGVKHASPQVLLIKNQEVTWHTSHWDITKKAIQEKL